MIDGADFEVEVQTGQMGDADNSGDVSVLDVMVTVSWVLGEKTQGFHFPLADMDRSGDISVTDVLEIVTLILNK